MERLEKLLVDGHTHKFLRIVIEDGRVIDGTFQCVDKYVNVILVDTQETFADGTVCIVLEAQQIVK